MPAELLGREQPRIWSPPLRPLTPKTSLGFECVDFAEQVLGYDLAPWQRWLLIHGLELHPDYTTADPEPPFRFDTVVVIVSRQNGKTEAIKIKKLWRLYLDGAKTVIATAQDLANSEKAWAEAVEMAKAEPELATEIESVDRTNGKKALRLTEQRRYLVTASGRRAARGWSVDDLDVDELREHQTWEAWAAAAPTTLARPRSQIWGWSSAGDAASVVLRHLRAQGMRGARGVDPEEMKSFSEGLGIAEMDGEDIELGSSLALFEWSAPPGARLDDWEALAQANPSLGHGFLTQRKLKGLIQGMPEWGARMEYMSQWRPTAAGGPFPEGAWQAGIDAESDLAPAGLLGLGVAVSANGGMGYVAVAGNRLDGHVHVEVIASRAGTEWLIPWLTSPERALRERWGAVAWQLSGAPVSALTDALRATDLPCVDWTGPELGRASGMVQELVRLPDPGEPDDANKRRLFHVPQPVLDVPASTAAVKSAGDTWLIDLQRSPTDAAPLQAAFGAVWALSQAREPYVSAYEDHDLMIV